MPPETLSQIAADAIVLSRPDRVGDAIIASACFPALREKFPGRPLYYLARPVMAPLYEAHPLLAGFLPRPESAPELVQKLREVRATIIVHLHPDPLCYRAAWTAGVEHRVGYGHWLGWTLTQSLPDDRSAGLQHERDYNFGVLALLGIENQGDDRPSVHRGGLLRRRQHDLQGRSAQLAALRPRGAVPVGDLLLRWEVRQARRRAVWQRRAVSKRPV